jgi:hypothetical protein
MIIDKNLELATALPLETDGVETGAYIDIDVAGARSRPMWLVAVFTEILDGTSVVLKIQTDTASTFGSPTEKWASRPILAAETAAGMQVAFPVDLTGWERYARVYADNTGGGTTGEAEVYLVSDADVGNIMT